MGSICHKPAALRPAPGVLAFFTLCCLALATATDSAAQSSPAVDDAAPVGAAAGGSDASATTTSASSAETWADRIVSLLPEGRIFEAGAPGENPADLPLAQVRWALQDIVSGSLAVSPDPYLDAYRAAASEGDGRDAELARLYELVLAKGGYVDSGDLAEFLQSSDWFVNVAAYVEFARSLSYYDLTSAETAIRRALLAVPGTQGAELVDEAYYLIAVVAQEIAVTSADLPTAYAASQRLIELAGRQGRNVDAHGVVYNLAQLHSATYGFDATTRITEALVDYSRGLETAKLRLSLALHGKTLLRAGQPRAAIDPLERSLELSESDDDPFTVDNLRSLVLAYVKLEQVMEAEAAYARLVAIPGEANPQAIATRRVEAALLAAKGDTDRAYAMETAITDTISDGANRALLQPRPLLSMRSLSQEEPRADPTSPIALDVADFAGAPDLTLKRGLSADAFRDLGALKTEIALLADTPESADREPLQAARDAVMEAFRRGSPVEVADAIDAYVAESSDGETGIVDVFARGLTALRLGTDVPPPESTASPREQALSWIVRAYLALDQGRLEDAYVDLEKARSLAFRLPDVAMTVAPDLHGLDLTLAALEGNPDIALRAANAYVGSVRQRPRRDAVDVVLTASTAALERAGHLDPALELADLYATLAQSAGPRSRASALFTKGRILYRQNDFARAALHLEDALDTLVDRELEPFVQRALYPSLAGSGRADEARAMRRELGLNLTRLGDPATSASSQPYIAHGDALLAENDTALSALSDWADAREAALLNQRQRQARLSGFRTEAAATILADEAERHRTDEALLTRRTRSVRALSIVLGGAALVVLGLLAWALHSLRRARQLQRSSHQAALVKGRFLNMIGHEARIRLQGIGSFADSLKASSLSLEQLPAVQVIGAQADALSRSISDLVASARILSGDDPQRLDLLVPEDFKRRTTERAIEAIGKRDVTFDFVIANSTGPVLVEKDYLETAVDRLVRAAARSTRAGTIEVRLSSERSLRGPRLNIVVEDTGTGMSSQEIASLLQLFEADSSGMSRLDGAEGLDFPLANQAVKALGGVMRVHSEAGEGTRVSMSIPVRRAAANDPADSGRERGLAT